MIRLIILISMLITGCSSAAGPGETPAAEEKASATTLANRDDGPTQASTTPVRQATATDTPSPTSDPTSQPVPTPELLLSPDELDPEWGVAVNPVWSPDGTQILFALKVDNNLYYPTVLDLKEGAQIVVEHRMAPSLLELVWAPDGRHFAFLATDERLSGQTTPDVYVGSIDPPRATRISPRDTEVYQFRKVGAWLDAQTLIYESFTTEFRPRASGLFVSRIDEPGSRLLIWSGRWPDVSPDRRWIAYVKQGQLWIANPQGYERTAVLDEEQGGHFIAPQWSPDGNWIAVLDHNRDELIVVARDGSSRTKVAENVIAADIMWSPDGRFLLCARGNQWDHEWDLYLVEWRTGDRIQLTEGPGEGRSFDLSPDGTKVVFTRREKGTPWEALYQIDLTQINHQALAGEIVGNLQVDGFH